MMAGDQPAQFLDLYNYRQQVATLYRERNLATVRGVAPEEILAAFRRRRDELFATHPQSALDAGQRARFTGLHYYPYNPAAVVEATVRPAAEASSEHRNPMRSEAIPVPLQPAPVSAGGEEMPLALAARLEFSLGGWAGTLPLYWIDVYGGGLFLPFRDATAPAETYGGGRYLFDTVKGSDFLALPSRDNEYRLLLDFNYAYNPSCAYNPMWVCPLAPPENHLPIRIEAGEQIYPDTGRQ